MDKIAEFIRENEIEHDWRDKHFFIWPSYYEMDDLKDIIPWDDTEYRMIENAAVSSDGVCIDLMEVFDREDIERFYPRQTF